MQKDYTTGELAKLCNVTKRTVQFYDKEGIVNPSKIGENGRRIYTQEDLKKFQLVCLYKNLGLPLKEIKIILESENQYTIIEKLLINQQENIDVQIQDLTELKNKLTTIINEISLSKSISISNDEELKKLLKKNEHHNKIEKMTYLLLIFYIIILFLSFLISSLFNELYMYLMICINVLLLFILIYIHAKHNAYVCPNCHKKFTISIIKDLFTLNNGNKGKYLKCPNCQYKNWISETYKDDC